MKSILKVIIFNFNSLKSVHIAFNVNRNQLLSAIVIYVLYYSCHGQNAADTIRLITLRTRDIDQSV